MPRRPALPRDCRARVGVLVASAGEEVAKALRYFAVPSAARASESGVHSAVIDAATSDRGLANT